jgi:leucyl aminopeptidase (aminopeptidase T)
MTRADAVEIDFVVAERKHTLRLELAGQEAQKSHGLCHGGPDVANLPAGEVYFVPISASGAFPLRLESGTLGLMTVSDGRIVDGRLLKGDGGEVDRLLAKFRADPASGAIGELGFGTQDLPVSGSDIQDEKILGTVHIATGRSDHLGGDVTPDKFRDKSNATHEDILFAPHKTPEVAIPEVRMEKNGEVMILIANYQPRYMRDLLG